MRMYMGSFAKELYVPLEFLDPEIILQILKMCYHSCYFSQSGLILSTQTPLCN